MENYNNQGFIPDSEAGSLLGKGIAAAILAEVCPPAGIILGAMGNKQKKALTSQYGALYGKAKVGGILSTIFFWVALACTIIIALYIILLICGVAAGVVAYS